MRPGLKTALTFTAGLLVGAVVWGGVQKRSFWRVMKQVECIALNQGPSDLQQLSSEKRTRLWRESLLEGLPHVARRADFHREDPDYASILWNVRLTYALYDRPVPEEIQSILSNLPADSAPRCPMPRRKLALPPQPTAETPKTSQLNDPRL